MNSGLPITEYEEVYFIAISQKHTKMYIPFISNKFYWKLGKLLCYFQLELLLYYYKSKIQF